MTRPAILARTTTQLPVEMWTLSNPASEKACQAKLVLLGGVHGDEPEGAILVEDFIQTALSDHGARLKSLGCEVFAIPRYNPDGLAKNERTNARGVDLNRNFPSLDWSNFQKAPRYNPGPHAESENETKALVALLNRTHPFLVIHCHTYSPQICYTGAQSLPYAKILAQDFGHPVTEDIGYPTPGSLGQYCDLNLKTACVCVELPEGVEQKTAWNMVGRSLFEIAERGPSV